MKAGRSTVDESSLTGEPMPVTKIAGVCFLNHLILSYVEIVVPSLSLNSGNI